MALRHAILAALVERESSGYDLAKAFDVSVANYWAATPQQLYRELERMESAGLVRARVVEQEKRPNKRLFSLTEAGRNALRDFAGRPPRPTAIRDELLVQVEAMDYADTADLRTWITEKLALAERKVERYLAARDRLLDGRSEAEHLARGARLGPYLTLARGISFEEENIRWCRFALATIARRADDGGSR